MALTSPPRAVESAVGATAHAARPLVPRPAQHVVPSGPQMCLALARPLADGQYETLALNPGEPIRDLNLKLTNRGWYSGKSCIVFGDRELADAVRLSDLVSASGKATPAYLHVFVKLTDVESVTMRTLMRELSLSNPVAAEQQLAATMMRAATSGTSLLALPCATQQAEAAEGVASVGVEELPSSSSASASSGSSSGTPFAASFSSSSDASDTSAQDAFNSTNADCDSHSRAVVHLCIHKSAKVNWHHMSENKFELSISSSETVESLMRKIEAANGISLEPGSILIDGQPLSAGQPLAAYGINRGITKLELVPLEPEANDAEALPDGSPSLSSPAHGLHQHFKAARAGLAEGLAPTLAKAGTGGSYFLQDVSGRPVAVFKPEDEEPLAINNPKGRTPGSSTDCSSSTTGSSASGGSKGSEGLRRGTKPGEGAVREVAAYVLDHGHFSGVPPTALVSAYVSEDTSSSSGSTGGAVKVGSLQQFVESEGDCEERGYSGFPVSEVHKIAVLDLRLANADRNAGNILARRKRDGSGGETWELIPIDHGYCLPASFEDLSFEWMYWPQAEQPFSESTLAYIAALDADRDIATLAAHGITLRPECERVFRTCTLTLQKGAAAGLTPSQIAGILCREGLTKSVIEKLHSNATQLARAGGAAADARGARVPQAAYLQKLGVLLDEYLEDYLLECADLLY